MTNSEINSFKTTYVKYFLQSKIVPIIFTAVNVNIFLFLIWSVIFYIFYFEFTLKRIEANLSLYNTINTRLLPFIIFVVVTIILQYIVNVFIMRDKCGNDTFIDFTNLNVYTIFIWLSVYIIAFLALFKFPKFKAIYSNTIIHKLFYKFMSPSRGEIYGKIFKLPEESTSTHLQQILKQIHCYYKSSNKSSNDIQTVDCTNITNKPSLFLDNINFANHKEYLQLLEPIIKEENINLFVTFLIKKDMLSEFVWMTKIGLFVILTIYLKLKSLKCLNHKQTHEEDLKEFISSKLKKCGGT